MAIRGLNLSRCILVGLLICLWGGLLLVAIVPLDSYSLRLPGESPFRWRYVYPSWCWSFFGLEWHPEAFLAMLALALGLPMIIAARQKAWRQLRALVLCILVMFLYSAAIRFDWWHAFHRDWLHVLFCLLAFGLTPMTVPLVASLGPTRIDKGLCIGAYFGLIVYAPILMVIDAKSLSARICVFIDSQTISFSTEERNQRLPAGGWTTSGRTS